MLTAVALTSLLTTSLWSQPSCALPTFEHAFLTRAVDRWDRVQQRLEKTFSFPQQIILFDARCVWTLRPTAQGGRGTAIGRYHLTIDGAPHNGRIRLPNRADIPIQPLAFAATDSASGTFFVLASLTLWKTMPGASSDPNLEARMEGVVSHELVHTVQLGALSRRIREASSLGTMPSSVDDNVIENNFATDSVFARSVRAEIDLLYKAVFSNDVAGSRELACQALALARTRRNQRGGERAMWAVVEDAFLNLEGVAEWVRIRSEILAAHDHRTLEERVQQQRGTKNDWSQEVGFALVLLLERLNPSIIPTLVTDELPSPWMLLGQSLQNACEQTRK